MARFGHLSISLSRQFFRVVVGSIVVSTITVFGRAEPGPTYFPFPLDSADAKPGTATDVSFLNHAPAGKFGRVIVKDGQFVTPDDGQRIRFWAVNVAGPELFTATKEETTAFAAHLAKHGVNMVRLHHLDNCWSIEGGGSLWDKSTKKRVVDPVQLDKLHHAIAAFGKVGIYVNLNTKVSKELTSADGLPAEFDTKGDWTAGFPHQKRVDRFSRFFIDHQKEFARTLWGTLNPYTGKTPADDPIVAIAEINNENSLLSLWPGMPQGQDLEKLPPFLLKELREKWSEWLSMKYGTDEKLLATWGVGFSKPGPALTSAKTPWIAVRPGPSDISVVNTPAGLDVTPTARFRIDKITGTDWHAQGILPNLTFENGKVYTVRFDARAKPSRALRVSADLNGGDYRSIGWTQSLDLTDQWKEFDFTFVATGADGDRNRITLQLGNAVGEVEVRSFKIFPGTDKPLLDPSKTLAGKNIDINPTTTAPMRADWIAFLVETELAYSREMKSFLRTELGLRQPLIDTQVEWGGAVGFAREADSDFIDTHSYWQHPQFGASAWNATNWTVGRKSLVDDMADGGAGTLGGLARYRVAGKPFAVSEYDHPAPNDFMVENVPMIATFAALQDWDAVYGFCAGGYGSKVDSGKIGGFFDQTNNPAKFCFYPSVAVLFRGASIRPQTSVATLSLIDKPWQAGAGVDQIWRTTAGTDKLPPLDTRFEVVTTADAQSSFVRTGEISHAVRIEKFAGQSVYIAESPSALALVGFVGGQTIETVAGSVKFGPTDINHGALTLVSLDGKPLASSRRMLLTLMGRAENTGAVWNKDRTSVGNKWGTSPVLVEGLTATIDLNGEPVRNIRPLSPDGSAKATIAVGAASFDVSPEQKTVWYEITR